ncbi:MAG: hypothetical protein ACYCZ7_00965 [Minisyncoccota bacterium]
MVGLNFEQPGNEHTPPFFNLEDVEKRDRLSADEISEQLAIGAAKYEAALDGYKAGDIDNKDYLENYRANLIDWKNDMQIMSGMLSKENKEIYTELEKRLALVSDALKQKMN